MTLLERIKLKCKEENLTIKALEQMAGFSNATIAKWETQKPSYEKVVIIANCLHVSLNWLILGKETDDLTPEEQKLVDCYRQADDRGKRRIMGTAELERAELASSSSRTG